MTEKRAAVKLAERKNSTKPRPNTQRCNEYQNWAVQADSTRGKRKETEKLSAQTTLTRFWQFYQQMEGNGRTKTTPDLKDPNKARLKTNEEKGQALLGRFIQLSNQNNLDERKHVLTE